MRFSGAKIKLEPTFFNTSAKIMLIYLYTDIYATATQSPILLFGTFWALLNTEIALG